MGVGPPGRTGRDQLSSLRAFVIEHQPGPHDVVVVACTRGAGGTTARGSVDGSPVLPVSCAGSLHTSVVEYLVRAGAGGVLIVSCPPRDCWNREGPKWLEQRLYHDREAELQERVDRRRVRLAYAAEGEGEKVLAALAAFRADLAALERAEREEAIELLQECDIPADEEATAR
jgi:coenzyme F420-reducing hydrogenase delta subunit